jgi:hypothetical protein
MILQRAIVLGVLIQCFLASGPLPTTAPIAASPKPKAQRPTPKARTPKPQCQTSDSPRPEAQGLKPGSVLAARTGAFTDDRRLDALVRLDVNGAALPEILAGLEKQSGVDLQNDAGMAELKAVALAKGLSLRTAMRELAALFGAEWTRRGSGTSARYLLARSSATRRRASELHDRFEERQRASVAALIAATHAEDPQRALETANPTVARKWTRPQIPASLRLFDFATHGHYVLDGIETRPSVAYKDLSPEQQAQAREALLALAGWQEAVGNVQMQQALVQASQEPAELVFEGALGEMESPGPSPEMKVGERRLAVIVRSSDGDPVLQMSIHVGPMPLPEDPADPAESAPPPAAASSAAILGHTVRLNPEDGLVGTRPTVPLHKLLSQVARQTGVAVFADYFYSRPRPLDLSQRWEGTLEALLRRFEQDGQTEWTLDGSVLRLRSRRWAVDESRDPPRNMLAALSAAVRKQGRLEMDDAVRTATMNSEQLDGLCSWAHAQDGGDALWNQVQGLGEKIGDARPLLRLYAALTPAQRRSLPTGITLEALDIGQQPMFLEAAMRLLPAAAPEQRARMRLRLDAAEDCVAFVALFPDDVRIERPLPIAPPALMR